MYYYEVLVGDSHFHGEDALTYAHDEELPVGTIVRVTLRKRSALAVVTAVVPTPPFKTKSISAVSPAPALPAQIIQLLQWIRDYYPAPLGVIVRQFLPPTPAFPKKLQIANYKLQTSPLPPLTPEQTAALKQIQPSGLHLLHGVTGSGKSRVYLELALAAFKNGKSSIVLTPEIGLTTQLARDFQNQFGDAVVTLHSRLTEAQRRDIWYELLSSATPRVVIGARSALFAPLQSIGLIVIDECHDQAYKSDSAPRYRTDRVAAKLAVLHACPLVLLSLIHI